MLIISCSVVLYLAMDLIVRNVHFLGLVISYFKLVTKKACTNDVAIACCMLGECIALWGEPNELSIQYCIYIFIQYVDS